MSTLHWIQHSSTIYQRYVNRSPENMTFEINFRNLALPTLMSSMIRISSSTSSTLIGWSLEEKSWSWEQTVWVINNFFGLPLRAWTLWSISLQTLINWTISIKSSWKNLASWKRLAARYSLLNEFKLIPIFSLDYIDIYFQSFLKKTSILFYLENSP